ncbi:SRPBCC domain-containing protein [Membranihabitans maritimus]|uniref:SRPBCC domain-containing protein n=1 Tax=Membranihabitans maritimus TaxID=2904244 RepID=UPI001F31C0C5|nr:SRPBCC domain-containing protein [Membranihabitans maritimus]
MKKIDIVNYIKSPSDRVYEALTTQVGLSQIWTSKLKVKPEVGYTNVFDFDEGYITKFQVTKLTENKRISWTCTESNEEWVGTGVTFDLTEKMV